MKTCKDCKHYTPPKGPYTLGICQCPVPIWLRSQLLDPFVQVEEGGRFCDVFEDKELYGLALRESMLDATGESDDK